MFFGTGNIFAPGLFLPSFDEPATVRLPKTFWDSISIGSPKTGAVFRRHDGREYARKKYAGGQTKTALRAATIRAGLRQITMNVFRDTWAIWFLALYGRDKEKLLRAGRWASARSIGRYQLVTDADLDEVRESLLRNDSPICELFRKTAWPDLEEQS